MATHLKYTFEAPCPYKGTADFSTGIFIDGKFTAGSEGKTIEVFNPTNGKKVCDISEGTPADVDTAVKVAHRAFQTSWGLKVPGSERGRLLMRLADLIEKNAEELAAIEALDNGKAYSIALDFDVTQSAAVIRYYGGWADKIQGKTIEVDETKFAYTLHEPIGVVGQIIPWNFPLYMLSWKLGPALACGNTVVLKTSEFTPLSALRVCTLINEAGFPPGVVNIITGYGQTVGAAIANHMDIEKVAFTGSTLVGRSILKASANTNLKKTTLELGGKSPNIIFDDCNLEDAVKWTAFGIMFNHGQCCCAGSRVYVQEGIYDKFIASFAAHIKTLKVGDPMDPDTFQGPQVSQIQYDRIMGYIQSGKEEGATLLTGGERHGKEGYFIQPTVFTDVKPNMKIVREEIFGPVVVVVKFKDEDDILHQANDTFYGLAAAVFSRDISRAILVASRLQAGTVWVNCYNKLHPQVPFGGYKQSGVGRELGEYALANYCNIKSVQINIGAPAP
ncbi:aldehyde dehydrogenase [Dacryopinax primogenitus]|uniref:Aldehyde dehydrogenase n=1 Tax=Dacryopinax primogenitus (strain DJM 731) TaxID=1858805 RepID=M5FUK0_DACPD|nr:aldehyde dehydrogenase [Dacryopinax primogenitus]EJT99149.1 aldehyde dehydrogenase [Dacryopinax primogenitus]